MTHADSNKPANREKIARFVRKAAESAVEIIVFPEMCVTGYWHVRNLPREQIQDLAEAVPAGETTDSLLALSREHRMTIGAGLLECADDGSLYNSYVVAMPDGTWRCHRKIHSFESPHISCETPSLYSTPPTAAASESSSAMTATWWKTPHQRPHGSGSPPRPSPNGRMPH